jgi:hypothetical protein
MNWADALAQIKTWQNNNPNQPKCFLITAADIAQLNAQLSNGMGALRVYLGQNLNGALSVFFIGCVRDGSGGYDDYNIPSNQSAWNTALGSNALPLVKGGTPCPTACSSANYLNT